MARSKEYRGKVLPELVGKKYFTCEICQCLRSVAVNLDIHHYHMVSSGGLDDRSNLRLLDTNCHSTLHRIGQSMAGVRSDKKPAYELAQEYAESVNPLLALEVANTLLEYATVVATDIALKKSKQIEPTADVDTMLSLPPKFNALFKMVGRVVKDAQGKRLSKERLLTMAALNLIKTHFPETKDEINSYIMTDILKMEAKPTQQPSGITAQRM